MDLRLSPMPVQRGSDCGLSNIPFRVQLYAERESVRRSDLGPTTCFDPSLGEDLPMLALPSQWLLLLPMQGLDSLLLEESGRHDLLVLRQ